METGIRPPIQMAVDSMRNLCLGYTGEANAQLIQIDVSKWQDKWPGASIDLMLALPGEKASYPAKTELKDGKLLFLPGYGDTQKPGHGAAYVVATKDGTHLAASDTVLTEIMHKGRGGDELPEAPEAQTGWVAEVLDAAHRAEEAAKRAENAGGGTITDEQIGKAVEDYLQENPIEVPAYELPTASADTLGGVKVGKGLRMDGDALKAEVRKEDIDKLSEEIVAKYARVEIRNSDPAVSEMYNGRMWIVLGAAEEEPGEKVYPPFFTIGYSIGFKDGLITYDWGKDRIGVATLNSDGVAPSIPAGATYVSETAYPIPVPADASTISVVCDGYMWGVGGFAYADGTYTYNLDPGWKSSGQTVSLEAGSVDYVIFNLKKTDNSEIPKETDTSGISIVIE